MGAAAVGPYFQYCVLAGNGCGYTSVIVIVDPGVQPEASNAKRPCGNTMFSGAVPAGGDSGSPVTGTNAGFTENSQAPPPPVRVAVIVPVPVGLAPMYVKRPGVIANGAEFADVPTALRARTTQEVGPAGKATIVSGEPEPVTDIAPHCAV